MTVSSNEDEDGDIESSSLPVTEASNRGELYPPRSPVNQGAPVDIARNTTPDGVS